MTVHIRQAKVEDYPAIATIARESQELHAQGEPNIFSSGTPGFAVDYVQDQLASEHSTIFVAENGEALLGYAFVKAHLQAFLEIYRPQIVAEITDIAVTQTARGQGIGRLLFEASKAWAREQKAVRLELTVWEFNTNAIAFYERLGMHTLSRVMGLPLEASQEKTNAQESSLQ